MNVYLKTPNKNIENICNKIKDYETNPQIDVSACRYT